jgi:plasmid stabilization system protein ParE
MFPVVWSETADEDLAEITDFIGRRNLIAAESLWLRIRESVVHLPEHPYLYATSERMPGCRQIVVHPTYIVIDTVGLRDIQVLRVLHARQQYPK